MSTRTDSFMHVQISSTEKALMVSITASFIKYQKFLANHSIKSQQIMNASSYSRSIARFGASSSHNGNFDHLLFWILVILLQTREDWSSRRLDLHCGFCLIELGKAWFWLQRWCGPFYMKIANTAEFSRAKNIHGIDFSLKFFMIGRRFNANHRCIIVQSVEAPLCDRKLLLESSW